jgi:peptidyl-prolyl cis-trans isomerase C
MSKRMLNAGIIVLLLGFSLLPVGQLFSESEVVLAKVGNVVVTQRHLDELISRYSQFRKGSPVKIEEKKMLLDNYIKGAVLAVEAEKEKLDQSPEVKSKLDVYRAEILTQEYINTKMKPSVTVTENEIDEKMKENPNLIPREGLTLREILVKTEKEAEAIYEELKKGKNFGTIASEKSKANTSVYGGRRKQPVTRGQLPKALEEVAFKLKNEEFSKPIKTDEGYYLLFLEERKERSPEEMKRLEGLIRERIKQIEITKKTQEMAAQKAEELKKNTKVEVYYDRIQ